MRAAFKITAGRGPAVNYIFLVVSAPIAPVPVASAGAVVVAAESVVMVDDDSVAAGVVVVVSVVAVFDSHEVRPTAMKRAAADTLRRLFIWR